MEPTAKANPELFSVARDARGLSQSELARRLGKSQGYVSRVEAGTTEPSDEFVQAVAAELGFPVAFFHEQMRVYGASVSELYHRKRRAAPARALSQVHAWLNVVRMNVERLLRAADLPTPTIPRLDVEDFESPEEVARVVRAQWQLRPGPFRDLVGTLEDAGVLVVRLDFPTRHIDAIGWWVADLPPLIFVNKDVSADKERWSCAHELGHLVMHRMARPTMEAEADRFAAELLMPEFDVAPHLEDVTSLHRLQALKLHWRVAMSAILRRAKELGKISPEQYRDVLIRMSSMGYRTREPAESEFPKEEASTVQQLFDLHLGELGFTPDQLAQHLRISAEDMQRLYGRQGSGLRVVR